MCTVAESIDANVAARILMQWLQEFLVIGQTIRLRPEDVEQVAVVEITARFCIELAADEQDLNGQPFEPH